MNSKLAVSSIFLFAFLLSSQSSYADEIHFLNGDKLTGKILETGAETIRFSVEGIGPMVIERGVIKESLTDFQIASLKAKETAKEKPEKPWNIEIEGGFDRKRGNTKTTTLNAETTLGYKHDRHEIKLKGSAYYSAEDRKMNAQKYKGLGRYDYRLGKAKEWFVYSQLEADRDRFANIDIRYVPQAGIGYWFVEEDDFKLKAEVGAGFEHTEFRDDTTDNTTEMVVVPKGYFEKKFFDRLIVSEEVTVYPTLTDGEYRLESISALEAPLNDHLSLKLKLINDWNSNPGKDTKKHDLHLISSVAVKY